MLGGGWKRCGGCWKAFGFGEHIEKWLRCVVECRVGLGSRWECELCCIGEAIVDGDDGR